MKKEKKKILPGAIFASFVAAVVVYCILINIEVNALSAYEKGKVLAAGKEIPGGLIISRENVEEYFLEVEMDKSLIPDAAITVREELLDRMAVGSIDKGAIVTQAMMMAISELQGEMREPVLAGFVADDLYQVVSGTLRSGDRIHIYTVDEMTEEANLTWENVFVREVFSNAGEVIAPEDSSTAAQRVNILIERSSVEKFYSELARGSLRVVKVLDAETFQ